MSKMYKPRATKKNTEGVAKARKDRHGAPVCIHQSQAVHLHNKLDHALIMLGGAQQPPHWDREPTPEMLEHEERLNREAYEACEDVICEIASALGVNIEIINGENEQDIE